MNDSHQRAAEYHDRAAHAHRAAAEHHGRQDHLTGHERSRQALEHSSHAYQLSLKAHGGAPAEHAANALAQEATPQDIAALAFQLWQDRGCPEGSPDQDWLRAAERLRSRR